MALTGLFLCLFLVIHLFGNLQLLLPAEVARWQFNFYSKLLSENIFIELISYVLFASILAHAIYALLITVQNKRSNGRRADYVGAWKAKMTGLFLVNIYHCSCSRLEVIHSSHNMFRHVHPTAFLILFLLVITVRAPFQLSGPKRGRPCSRSSIPRPSE
jgi:succinate dehydrogenase/fumarate reductase cytochrome b subunit